MQPHGPLQGRGRLGYSVDGYGGCAGPGCGPPAHCEFVEELGSGAEKPQRRITSREAGRIGADRERMRSRETPRRFCGLGRVGRNASSRRVGASTCCNLPVIATGMPISLPGAANRVRRRTGSNCSCRSGSLPRRVDEGALSMRSLRSIGFGPALAGLFAGCGLRRPRFRRLTINRSRVAARAMGRRCGHVASRPAAPCRYRICPGRRNW
jgi:hypothetical protein